MRMLSEGAVTICARRLKKGFAGFKRNLQDTILKI